MRGIWTALVTPFNDKNEIDLSAFKRILKDQLAAGVTGVIPCGTTGESPTLTKAEKKLLIRTALDELKGSPVKVVAGTGTADTAETIEFSKWASEEGVDGLLLVTPYYNKPSQAGLEAHFRAVADATSCEIILYNVPGRTGISLTAETITQLVDHPRIKTLKEATGNVAFTSEILDRVKLTGRTLDILSGDDATFLPLLSVGAVGVISVASNLFPRAMVRIHNLMEKGSQQEAMETHQQYYPLFRDLFIESNPVGVKYAMDFVGWCRSHVRLPLAPLSAGNEEKLRASLIRCGISKEHPA